MNTKEAIEFMENILNNGSIKYLLPTPLGNKMPVLEIKKRIKSVIEILKKGEKYEAMWGDLKSECGTFFRDVEEGRCLGEMMAKMEYEWFPKPVKKTITIDKDLISELAKEISKCFREWIEKHLLLDLPITPEKLAILSDSIIKGIENSVKNIKEGD